MLTFGLIQQEDSPAMQAALADVARYLGEAIGQEVVARPLPGYEALAAAVAAKELDIAWLPPLVHIQTPPRAAIPVVSARRGGDDSYESVLIAAEGSTIEGGKGLTGLRAAWVDPWSAAGFVVPRMKLVERGFDPRELFRFETFAGSHTEVAKAVLEGRADVGGTFARFAKDGTPKTGGWRRIEGAKVHVVERYGEVPPDVVCTSAELDGPTITKVEKAFVDAGTHPEVREHIHLVFGADEFRPRVEGNYGDLRREFEAAKKRGLFAG